MQIKGSDVVFLFLTAMGIEEDIINGYEAGTDDYMTKPLFSAVLVSKVNVIMSRIAICDTACNTNHNAEEKEECHDFIS